MSGKIIMFVVSFGCAILFFGIGIYAKRLKKPMWFWTGSEVDPSQITDIRQYNKEIGIMWQLYSLWYFATGIAEIWNSILALILLVLSCTVGIVFLIITYNKIYKKYSIHFNNSLNNRN